MKRHSCPYCQCGECQQHKPRKQRSGLTSKQKQQIINICKRNPQSEEIGGLILEDGTITQEVNHAGDRRNTFQFTWDGKPAVGIWHRHLKKLGHSEELSQPDIDCANQSGLSMYMVYDAGDSSAPYSSYKWAEYHPNGTPNEAPVRNYNAIFSCPTKEQLEKIIKESNQRIDRANQKYKEAVAAANVQIQKQQQKVRTTIDRTILTAANSQNRIDAIALKLQLLGDINNVNIANQQCNHRHSSDSNGRIRLPERGRTPAIEGSSQTPIARGWMDRESHQRENQGAWW